LTSKREVNDSKWLSGRDVAGDARCSIPEGVITCHFMTLYHLEVI